MSPRTPPPETAPPSDTAAALSSPPLKPLLDIIVVEDNDALREQLLSFLARPGWRLRGADCGEQLDALLREGPAHLLVLDLNLPFEDGHSIALRMRAAFPQMGIVMLTARARPSDRTAGYASGADVYLTKPTNVEELESVVQNLARRLQPAPEASLVLDLAHLDLRDTQAGPGGQVSLSLTETQLLRLLAMAPQRQLDTDYLLYQLYGEAAEAGNKRDLLAVMISRLRLKLNASALPHKDLVRAVRGVGYRLTASLVVR